MDVLMLPSALGGGTGHPLSSYVVNGRLAVDAGCIGFYGTVAAQAKITDVVLTHSHLDHVGGLPILVDNIYEMTPACVTVHATEPVLTSLQVDVFNNRLYPDMIALSKKMTPFLKLSEIRPRQAITIADVNVLPIPVDHVVPCVGLILDDGDDAVAIVTDTAPTQEIWEVLADQSRLRAVFLECSFPSAHLGVAQASKHMTTALFNDELQKIPHHVPVFAVHIKPRFAGDIERELLALGNKRIRIARPGRLSKFGR